MKILAIENGYEPDIRMFDSYRELVQAIDSPRTLFCPDEIYLVEEELTEEVLRARALAEGDPLPLIECTPENTHPYAQFTPTVVAYATKEFIGQSLPDLLKDAGKIPGKMTAGKITFGKRLWPEGESD